MRWRWLAVIVPLLLQGCATAPMQIKGGGFLNETAYEIRDAELKVEKTGQVASCSYIAPQGFFGTQLPLQPYQQHTVRMRWTSRGRTFESGPFVIPAPDPIPDEPVVAVIRLHENGTSSAKFVPVSEIPERYTR